MSDVVSWVVDMSIKPGQLDNFKGIVEELVQSTRNEPNTRAYEWFLSEDNSSCHVCERYADSAATLAHLGTFGEKFGERFMTMVDIKSFTVYGAPNDEVKAVLGGFGATFMGQLNGLARGGKVLLVCTFPTDKELGVIGLEVESPHLSLLEGEGIILT